MLSGIFILSKFSQYENAELPSVLMLFDIEILFKELQLEKACFPIDFMFEGSVTSLKLLQPMNKKSLIIVRFSDKLTSYNLEQ